MQAFVTWFSFFISWVGFKWAFCNWSCRGAPWQSLMAAPQVLAVGRIYPLPITSQLSSWACSGGPVARWALLMTHAPPCTHPAARAAGGRWVAKGQRTSRLDGQWGEHRGPAEVTASLTPPLLCPAFLGPRGFPWEWVLQDHRVRLCVWARGPDALRHRDRERCASQLHLGTCQQFARLVSSFPWFFNQWAFYVSHRDIVMWHVSFRPHQCSSWPSQ